MQIIYATRHAIYVCIMSWQYDKYISNRAYQIRV